MSAEAEQVSKPSETVKNADAMRTSKEGILVLTISEREVLRGTLLSAVLSRMGDHFRVQDLASQTFSREEAERMYASSFRVDHLDKFLSHCWRSSRIEKTLALLLNNNLPYALVASTLTCCATSALVAAEYLPHRRKTWLFPTGDPIIGYHILSPWTVIVSALAFFIVILFGHNALDRLGRGRVYFFDKLCVCQYDEKKKNNSIYSFAALVNQSSELVMLWDEHYFTRLWCTLEMASFVRTHRNQAHLPLTFLPLQLPKVSVWVWLVCWFSNVLHIVAEMIEAPISLVIFPTMFVASYALFFESQKYLKHRRNLDHQIESFSLANADCKTESDRQIVLQSVKSWFGDLHHFDRLVHTVVKDKVHASIGSVTHFPLRYGIVVIFVHFWSRMEFIMTSYYSVGGAFNDPRSMYMRAVADLIFWPLSLLSIIPVAFSLSSFVKYESNCSWFVTICYGSFYSAALLLYVAPLYMVSITFASNEEYGLYIGGGGSIVLLIWNAWLFRNSFYRFVQRVQEEYAEHTHHGASTHSTEEDDTHDASVGSTIDIDDICQEEHHIYVSELPFAATVP
eukprot:TRINITY_DN37447_c0_g1_i1.p1 TRINITY_DN37447_c0_g1~~TRINITY_DN37447_c0_g1_i1.p1  ORF type:complete len:567 (+),score=48.03 TRINITY_DN37447_c0_g1_i1:64-1764(+)